MSSITNMGSQTSAIVHRVIITADSSTTRCGRTVTAAWLELPTAPVTCKRCNESTRLIARELQDAGDAIRADDYRTRDEAREARATAAQSARSARLAVERVERVEADHAVALIMDAGRTHGAAHRAEYRAIRANVTAQLVERAHTAALVENIAWVMARQSAAALEADHAAALVEDDARTYYGTTHHARILADKIATAHTAAILEDDARTADHAAAVAMLADLVEDDHAEALRMADIGFTTAGQLLTTVPNGLGMVLATMAHAAPGGGTLPLFAQPMPADGFIVGGHDGIPALIIPAGSAYLSTIMEAVTDWATEHNLFNRATFVGWWVEDGATYVDAVTHVPDVTVDSLAEAVDMATARGELALYGVESGQCLDMATRAWS